MGLYGVGIVVTKVHCCHQSAYKDDVAELIIITMDVVGIRDKAFYGWFSCYNYRHLCTLMSTKCALESLL